jgi:hypothetical protein
MGIPERESNGVCDAEVVTKEPALGAFYLIASALTWTYWIPDVLDGGHLSHFPGLLGPAIATWAWPLSWPGRC